MKEMKTFRDLEFKKHWALPIIEKQAVIEFNNGYGVSVVSGGILHLGNGNLHIIGILENGSLTYNSGITKDTIGYCNVRKVTGIMKKVQALKKEKT